MKATVTSVPRCEHPALAMQTVKTARVYRPAVRRAVLYRCLQRPPTRFVSDSASHRCSYRIGLFRLLEPDLGFSSRGTAERLPIHVGGFKKVDPPEGSVVQSIGVLESRIGGSTFLDPPRSLGYRGRREHFTHRQEHMATHQDARFKGALEPSNSV